MMAAGSVLKVLTGRQQLPFRGILVAASLNQRTTSICQPRASGQTVWIHTTPSQNLPGQEWRKKRGMAANPTSYGPLADGPDYSYLDGRPATVPGGKIRRALEQREVASKIIKLNAEMDFAVAHHKARVQNEMKRKSTIIQNKLKPKAKLPPETFGN